MEKHIKNIEKLVALLLISRKNRIADKSCMIVSVRGPTGLQEDINSHRRIHTQTYSHGDRHREGLKNTNTET